MPSPDGHLSILIIDDDPYDRIQLRRMLSQLDVPLFHEATTFAEAQVLLRDPPPVDMIFVDYYIPGVVDFELLHAVRAAYPQAPVILCTGASDVELARQAVVQGADAYMAKLILTQRNLILAMDRARRAMRTRIESKIYWDASARIRADLTQRGQAEE